MTDRSDTKDTACNDHSIVVTRAEIHRENDSRLSENNFKSFDQKQCNVDLDEIITCHETDINQCNTVSETIILPRITISVDNYSYTCLIDSGSSHNLINREIINKKVTNQGKIQTLYLADKNMSINVIGEISLLFRIQDTYVTQTFLVVENLRDAIILGIPFLTDQEVVLDFYRGCVYFGINVRTTTHLLPLRHNIPKENALLPDLPDISRTEQIELSGILKDFQEVFLPYNGPAKLRPYRITLLDKRPIRIPAYRISDEKKRILYDQLEGMLSNGVIEASVSPYSFPIVMASKKNNELRFCVDYRKLNAITVDEPSFLPVIHETLKDLGGAKVFSSFDLQKGFWQVPLEESSRHLTAFTTPDGASYQFRVLPFGMKNSPSIFQRIMCQEVLAGFLRDFCMVYIDDIIIYSSDWKSHMRHLRLVLERLQQYNLKCAPDKCKIGVNELNFLGHVVTAHGNRPQISHELSITNYPIPNSRRKLRAFLGTLNWCREYIANFAEMAAPLTDLLSTKRPYRWNANAQQAMDNLKYAMSQPLKLCRPDFSRTFVLQTDASKVGMAAVLFHERPDGKRDIISYSSARFNNAEQRWHSNEQEAFAAVWAIKRYSQYLTGRRFILRTDNKALVWLHKFKDERAKLTRWALLLQEYNFIIEHCPGIKNELPDYLSRNPHHEFHNTDDSLENVMYPNVRQKGWKSRPTNQAECFQIESTQNNLSLAEIVRQNQRRDSNVSKIISHIENLTSNRNVSLNKKNRRLLKNYTMLNGYLHKIIKGCKNDKNCKLVVPKFVIPTVIKFYHTNRDAGHPGVKETIRAISQYYTWLGIERDVRYFIRNCMTCARTKAVPDKPRAPLGSYQAREAFEIISVDLMGNYPRSSKGNKYILVVTDLFTKWVEAFPMRAARAPQILNILEKEVFYRFGYPRAIISDNGSQFNHALWKSTLENWKCAHWTTAIFHARANMVERRNQEIKKGLRIHLLGKEHKHWDEHLGTIVSSIRRRENCAIKMSPNRALLGYSAKRPGEWNLEIHHLNDRRPGERSNMDIEIRRNQEKYKNTYAPSVDVHLKFHIGQEVMMKEHPQSNMIRGFHAGFAPKWSGPHRVLLPIGKGTTYWIERNGKAVKAHVDDLRLAPNRNENDSQYSI